jgi:hypothetical protein
MSFSTSPTPSFTTTTTTTSSSIQLKECDYDVNPSYLYQAVEAKQWQHVVDFLDSSQQEAKDQAKTWVIRKEPNGKLRWRLLPLHAAVIFGSPLAVIEKLLQEFPRAASLKDDQGMLPLHLCCRNFHDWNVLEELVAAHPRGILIKDRKGRTPLQCACTSFKKAASVMELYTHVAVTQQAQTSQREHHQLLQAKIQALQTTHVSTLERFKSDFQQRARELQTEVQQLQRDYTSLQQEHAILKQEYQQKCLVTDELTLKLNQMTQALTQVTDLQQVVKGEQDDVLREDNAKLKHFIATLVHQQQEMQNTVEKYMAREQERKQSFMELLETLRHQEEEQDDSISELVVTLQQTCRETRENIEKELEEMAIGNVDVDEYENEEDETANAISAPTLPVTENETTTTKVADLEIDTTQPPQLLLDSTPTSTTSQQEEEETSPWVLSPKIKADATKSGEEAVVQPATKVSSSLMDPED